MDIDQCACSGKTLDRFLRPLILALLSRAEAHGYNLIRQLRCLDVFACSPPDTSGIYKVLKSMEQERLVTSTWDVSSNGPAKRRYALTNDGLICMKRWIKTLEDYRKQIDGLLVTMNDAEAKHEVESSRKREMKKTGSKASTMMETPCCSKRGKGGAFDA
jgi:poly-beta-hydroxybutyrate-responsive repressor